MRISINGSIINNIIYNFIDYNLKYIDNHVSDIEYSTDNLIVDKVNIIDNYITVITGKNTLISGVGGHEKTIRTMINDTIAFNIIIDYEIGVLLALVTELDSKRISIELCQDTLIIEGIQHHLNMYTSGRKYAISSKRTIRIPIQLWHCSKT